MAEPSRRALTAEEIAAIRRMEASEEYRSLSAVARAIGIKRNTLHMGITDPGRRLAAHIISKIEKELGVRSSRRSSSARPRRRAGGRVRASL